MRSYRKGSHTVHDLKVHLVWITKYCYNVLTKEVGLRICELIRQVCDANKIEILQGRYAAFSSSHVTDEMIQEYLKHHKNHPNHRDDFGVEWLSVSTHKLKACIFQSALAETETFSLQNILCTFSA